MILVVIWQDMEALHDIFKREAKTLIDEFEHASTLGEGTSQEVAEFRENAFRDFIQRFYPHPHRVTKGKVRDSFSDGPSASIDCLIVNPEHPNLIDSHGKFQLLLADGIDIAIEVKPDLAHKSELERGLAQGVSVKRLRRNKGPIILERKIAPDILELSKQIPFYLYAHRAKEPAKLVSDMRDWYLAEGTPVENQIDGVVINKSGIIVNIKHPESVPWAIGVPDNEKAGWYFEAWGELTLGGMLLAMESSYHSRATVQERVLAPYLQKLSRPVSRLADPIAK